MSAPNTLPLNDLELNDADELARARKGLWKAQRIHVPRGQFLYRFASMSSMHLRYSGPWWFAFEHYKRIVNYAETAGLSLGYAARRFAGLAYEWPGCTVDALERALVVGRLDAWGGPGRVIEGTLKSKGAKTTHYTLAPPQDIMQLYIPGLRTGSGAAATRSAISLQGLQHCSCDAITSGQFA